MEKMNVLTLIITLVVGVILAGSLLAPVISDATKTTETFTNEGYYTMDKVATDANFSLTWDSTEPLVISINDDKIDLSDKGLVNNMSYTIFGGDNFVLRLRTNLNATVCQYYGSQTVTPAFMYADTATNSSMTAVVADGNITVSTTNPTYDTPASFTMTDKTYCINANDTGAYVMKKSNESAYIESNTDIIVLDGITTLAANDVGIYADGTINGDLDATTFRGTATYDVTFSDFVYTTENVSSAIDLVKLEKVVFTATQNNTDYTVTYSYFIVPTEVTAELANHLTPGQISLMGAIPVMVIVALLMVAVGAIAYRRAD